MQFQTFSPPPHELIGRVDHYLERTMQDWPNPTAQMEQRFHEYKRYLGLE
jgi:hypothetical protein